jgi:hypothetical protein
MGVEKSWCIQVKRPLKYWRSAPKPYLVWLTPGNFHAYRECDTFVYPVVALKSGSKTILSIIRTARGQRCEIRKENANA